MGANKDRACSIPNELAAWHTFNMWFRQGIWNENLLFAFSFCVVGDADVNCVCFEFCLRLKMNHLFVCEAG